MKTKVLSLALASLLLGLTIACDKEDTTTVPDPQSPDGEEPNPTALELFPIEVWQSIGEQSHDGVFDTINVYLFLEDSSCHAIVNNLSNNSIIELFSPYAKITVTPPYLTLHRYYSFLNIRFFIHSYDGNSILLERENSTDGDETAETFLFHKIKTI